MCICRTFHVWLSSPFQPRTHLHWLRHTYHSRTSFYDASGKPISAKGFIEKLFHKLPDFFHSEEELRKIWSAPDTRRKFLNSLAAQGYTLANLDKIKEILHAEHSDIFDVLSFIAYSKDAISREERVARHKQTVLAHVAAPQQDFIQFVLRQYVSQGISELDDSRLGALIKLKYGSPWMLWPSWAHWNPSAKPFVTSKNTCICKVEGKYD